MRFREAVAALTTASAIPGGGLRAPIGTCLLGLLLAPAPVSAQPPRDVVQPGALGTIRGQVIDASTRGPLRNATIRATSGALREPLVVRTDAEGRYAFAGLPPGAYDLRAAKPYYVDQALGRRRPNDPPRPITLGPGENIEAPGIAVWRGGVIAGTVVDDLGEPLEDAVVQVCRYEYTAAGRRLRVVARSRPTNDLGEYRVAGLPPGRYVLAAAPPNPGDDGVQAAVVLDRAAYAPTFYPAAGDAAAAAGLEVGLGDVLLAHSIAVRRVATASVRGRAVTVDGLPLAARRVSVLSDLTGGEPLRSSTVNGDGSFELTGLPSGAYTLRLGHDDKLRGSVMVEVSGRDVEGIDLVGARPAVLRGRVRAAPSSVRSRPPSRVTLTASAVDSRSAAGGDARVEPDLTFTLPSGPGPALLHVESSPPGWTIDRVHLNGVDVTETGLEVPHGGTVTGLDVLITDAAPELAVTVVDAQGDAVTDTRVIAFSHERSRWTYGSRYIAAARASADRRFVMRLPPGLYYVAVVDDAEPGEWYDPAYLATVVSTAASIRLSERGRSDLQLLAKEER